MAKNREMSKTTTLHTFASFKYSTWSDRLLCRVHYVTQIKLLLEAHILCVY